MMPDGITECTECGQPIRGIGGGLCEDCEEMLDSSGQAAISRLTAERNAAIARAERAEAVIAAARHALDDDVLSWVDNDAEVWASVRLTRHARLHEALAAYDKRDAG